MLTRAWSVPAVFLRSHVNPTVAVIAAGPVRLLKRVAVIGEDVEKHVKVVVFSVQIGFKALVFPVALGTLDTGIP